MPEKILVVDDDVDTLRLVGLMLQRQGYQIVAASNGQQALAMAMAEKPELILLDVMMPDMDGYEVTRRLRANASTASTPIIMFTAKSQVDDKVMGFEAGVDDYLTKPTQPRELFAHVKAVLARGRKTSGPAAPAAPARERGYVIGVIAAKGGLGVSTIAINLGISLRTRTRKDVAVAELRPGEGSLALELGYLNPEGMNRLLQKNPAEIGLKDVESELLTHKSETRLLLASYNPADAKYQASDAHFEMITRHLSYLANYIVLDLGPAISPITDKALAVCDELILALEPIPTTITRSQLLLEELAGRGFGEGRVNSVLYNRQRSEMQFSLAQVQKEFKHTIGIVFTAAPELVYQAARANVALVTQHPDNLTSQQFFKLADSIAKRVRTKE
ncbi:MAG TPA: response regulator [Anaerolineales bacterium]|nr:response regulator [Anaerolineales bacterium]